jgi:hypothetical protein
VRRYEVAGGASGMGVDRIGEVGNRASEGHIFIVQKTVSNYFFF